MTLSSLYIYFNKLLSLLSLKKYFLFSPWLLFFLPFSISFFFLSPSSPLYWIFIFITNLFWVCLRFVLGLSPKTHLAHVVVPRRQPISPNPPSHCSPNADKPSPPSHRQSKLHCQSKLHRRSKLHRHRLHRTQELCEIDLGRNKAEEFGFGGAVGFHGFLWVSWVSGGVALLVVICVVVFG